jgi:hypothetical protein
MAQCQGPQPSQRLGACVLHRLPAAGGFCALRMGRQASGKARPQRRAQRYQGLIASCAERHVQSRDEASPVNRHQCCCCAGMLGTGRRSGRGPSAHATLHPVGSREPCTTILPTQAKAAATETEPFLYDGAPRVPWLRSVARHPRRRSGTRPPRLARSGPQGRSLRHQASLEVAPQSDEKLPRQGDHHDPPQPPTLLADTAHEPLRECTARLVAEP